MGHIVGKDIYRQLGKKIDGLSMRAPWNENFHAILRELYSTDEADLVVRMPYNLSNLDQIAKITNIDKTKLHKMIDDLCFKGLIMDIWLKGEYYYQISPLVVGIFEFTMMRTEGKLNSKEWAKLFQAYMDDGDIFFKANFGNGKKVSPLRTIPHVETIDTSEYVEVLDFEKATSIVEQADKFCIGICSCRHEKLHTGEKECDVPLEMCFSFDMAADYLIRNKLGKEVSKTEMMEGLARSREHRLVFNADNIKNDISFICNCCGCCCGILRGISQYGYPNTVVTSRFIAKSDHDICSGCENCAEACPINAIVMSDDDNPNIDTSICIGCGVCALDCETDAMKLVKREQRVLYPEDTFERVILQCLERGTLQNQMFGNPDSMTHKIMRGVMGAFLKMSPVKKALMSDSLRSSFLDGMKKKALG
jgi:Pyruvate/2-oxoacid:ferredoxin oxidoreductase delta subunit